MSPRRPASLGTPHSASRRFPLSFQLSYLGYIFLPRQAVIANAAKELPLEGVKIAVREGGVGSAVIRG